MRRKVLTRIEDDLDIIGLADLSHKDKRQFRMLPESRSNEIGYRCIVSQLFKQTPTHDAFRLFYRGCSDSRKIHCVIAVPNSMRCVVVGLVPIQLPGTFGGFSAE